MKAYLDLLGSARGLIFWCIVLTGLAAVLNIALVVTVNDAISGGLQVSPENTALFFGAAALLFLVGVVSQTILRKLGVRVISSLRKNIAGSALITKYSRIESLGKSKVHASLTYDVQSIFQMFGVFPLVVFNALIIIGGLSYLAYLSPLYCIVLISVISVFILIFYAMSGRINVSYEALRNHEEDLNGNMLILTDGARELSISRAKKSYFYEKLLEPAIDGWGNRCLKLGKQEAVLNNLMSLAIFIIFGIILFFVYPSYPVEPKVISGFFVTLLFIRNPIGIVVESVSVFISASVAYSRVKALNLESEGWRDVLDEKVDLVNTPLKLEIKGVKYQYPEANGEAGFKIGPVNLNISSGEVVFITGANGSGKSTLGKILSSLYEPSEGSISLYDLSGKYGKKLIYPDYLDVIFSDFYLFDFFVEENERSIRDEGMDYWLSMLELDDKVEINGNMFSTTKLSHGQRKRLALVNSLISNKPILLFDEWAADQDPVFRSFFYNTLLPKFSRLGKMIIVISHDKEYFDRADRMYEMVGGTLVELNSRQVSSAESSNNIAEVKI